MSERKTHRDQSFATGVLCRPSFGRDLHSRRLVALELPEFLIYALECRLNQANIDASPDDCVGFNEYIEAELINLISVRDVAELELSAPGFGAAVQRWLDELRV